MDERQYLIILKGEDRTAEVLSYSLGLKVDVVFQKALELYKYNYENVTIKENPAAVDITNQAFYCNDLLIYDIKQMLDFSGLIKIFYHSGKSQIFDSESIRIENNCLDSESAARIIKYWKDISHHTVIDNEQESFLKKEFEKLTYVNPHSVLGYFLNKKPITIKRPITNNIIFPFKFNLSQKTALDNALTSNISIIEGPPGTGKTQTILNIIANLAIMNNKTVAVVSGNNAAVLNVKDKLEKNNFHFFVAALGNKENKQSFFKNLPQYDISDWHTEVEERILIENIASLNQRIDYLLELNNQKAKLQQKLSAYLLEKQHFEHYYENQQLEGIKGLSFYRKTPERIISFMVENNIARDHGKIRSIVHRVKLLFKYRIIDYKNMKVNEMIHILNLQRDYYSLKIIQLERIKDGLQDELDKESFEDLLNQHENYSTILFKNKLYERYHGKESKTFYSNTFKKKFDTFVHQFPVVLSTTHSLRNCIPENYLFDYVIIDESSQVDLLTGALALSCCKNAIIVGDTKQLPQIVNVKIKEKIDNNNVDHDYDYFKQNLLSSMIDVYPDSIPKIILKEHYRCHPQIIGFCNQRYYGGELIPFNDGNDCKNPLLLRRTAPGNHMREVTIASDKGKFNQRELDVILEEVLNGPDLHTYVKEKVGITTPYRKQVTKASRMLDDEMEIDTIHKYQGREKSVIIMSTVLDNTRSGKIGMKFVDDPCKINVAVSRAQNQFVLVTDYSLFNTSGKEVSELIRYMEYNALDEKFIESEIVSVFDLLYKEYSDKLIFFKSRLMKQSRYQSENIIWTLLDDILSDEKYSSLDFTTQVYLKNLLNNTEKLNPDELSYVNHNASVDFVIYYKLNKRPILVIEVDGFAFHENNPKQLIRDELKKSILVKYKLPLLRLPTTGSGEKEKIIELLCEII